MNITKILTEKLERRVVDLHLKNIVDDVVPILVKAEEHAVKLAVEEAEEASRLMKAKALERALGRAVNRVTGADVLKVHAEFYKRKMAEVASKKTDGSAVNSEAGVRGAAPQKGGQ